MKAIDAIKLDLDAIKFMMARTSDPMERVNLAALGLEKTTMFIQLCGYQYIIKESRENIINNMICVYDYNRPWHRRKKKAKIKSKKNLADS